jgi:hypothetical protein
MNDHTLNAILDAIDAANAQDPHHEDAGDGGGPQPRERLYGQRMSAWLRRLRPDAPPELQIAARAQHIRRWERPREDYPLDRRGYLAWRRDLYSFHADQAGAIMANHGASAEAIDRVAFLLHKKQLHDDPDTQALEDAACLVFLEFHAATFAAKTEHEKMVNILRKTWRKMSENGHAQALNLALTPEVLALVQEAIGND